MRWKGLVGWTLFLGGSIWVVFSFLILVSRIVNYYSLDMALFLWGPVTSGLVGIVLLGGIPVLFGIRRIKGGR